MEAEKTVTRTGGPSVLKEKKKAMRKSQTRPRGFLGLRMWLGREASSRGTRRGFQTSSDPSGRAGGGGLALAPQK